MGGNGCSRSSTSTSGRSTASRDGKQRLLTQPHAYPPRDVTSVASLPVRQTSDDQRGLRGAKTNVEKR